LYTGNKRPGSVIHSIGKHLNGKDNPEEPCEARVSSTVLRGPGGEIPLGYSISGWQIRLFVICYRFLKP
jgi:hypothetical protein